MQGLLAIGVAVLAVVLGSKWLRRRWDKVDSYYEREYREPPIADIGSYLGGDR